MEASAKDPQSPAGAAAIGPTSKPKSSLRSSTPKLRTDKSPLITNNPPSTSKRSRAVSNVSQSVSVLDLSAKGKSPKPPRNRRLSTPLKSALKPASNITPISEARVRKSVATTPLSDVSRSSARRKFNVLLSASYWLSQIKVSESVSSHSISLGFFRLALEAGCEPLQRLRDELKAYATRHNLTDLEDTVKPLFESYGIVETLEQLQISETHSQGTVDGTQSSSTQAVNVSRSLMDRKPSATQALMGIDGHGLIKSYSKDTSASKVRASVTRKSVTLKPSAEGDALQKRVEKSRKVKLANGQQDTIKKQEKKPADEVSIKPTEGAEIVEENKENMSFSIVQFGPPLDVMSVTEVM